MDWRWVKQIQIQMLYAVKLHNMDTIIQQLNKNWIKFRQHQLIINKSMVYFVQHQLIFAGSVVLKNMKLMSGWKHWFDAWELLFDSCFLSRWDLIPHAQANSNFALILFNYIIWCCVWPTIMDYSFRMRIGVPIHYFYK